MENRNLTELKELKNQIEKFTKFTIRTYSSADRKEQRDQINRNVVNGTYIVRQFVDAKKGLSEEEYNKWLKRSKLTFFHTINVNSLLMGNNIEHIKRKHSDEEFETQTSIQYTPTQILETLNILDLYTVMNLLTENPDFELIGYHFYLTGVYKKENGTTVKIGSKEPFCKNTISSLDYNQKQKFHNLNAHEVLFRYLRKPIKEILDLVNESINTQLLPEDTMDAAKIKAELLSKSFKLK